MNVEKDTHRERMIGKKDTQYWYNVKFKSYGPSNINIVHMILVEN
jgi:hypothetical protein